MRNYLVGIVALAVAAHMGCHNDSLQTGPTMEERQGPSDTVLSGGPTPPVVQHPTPAPTVRPTAEVVLRGDPYRVRLCTETHTLFTLAAYHDPYRSLAKQTLYWERQVVVVDDCKEFDIEVPCGRYQVDVFTRPSAPVPPTVDNTLLLGRIGKGDGCLPPPPPPSGCTHDCEPPPPPPVCEVPFGPHPKQGNPRAECGYFGAVPGPAGFYICKAGTEMFASTSPFTGDTCPNGKDISHITECECPDEQREDR
jgi:hypothetical protein